MRSHCQAWLVTDLRGCYGLVGLELEADGGALACFELRRRRLRFQLCDDCVLAERRLVRLLAPLF